MAERVSDSRVGRLVYDGIAIHGTYWHNDYSLPRSHSCVNVPITVVRPFNDEFVPGDAKEVRATQITVT
jgi:lipoprotein-anchoring transpeptidase ErfK/SrfK